METTLLRKLTEKSTFNFGKYAELTVRQVMDLKHPGYIRWCYFNLNGISFVDDLLERIIPPEYRIDKPGQNPELGDKLEEKIWGRMDGLAGYIRRGSLRKDRKKALESYCIKDSRHFSKSALQRVNHGHR